MDQKMCFGKKWPFDSFAILRPNVSVHSRTCAAFARTWVWLMLHPPVLGFFFCLFFCAVHVEMLHRTQLHSDNFNTYTPAHTNMSWHTYWLLCTKRAYARWNAHAELLWTFPSNVYASTTIKTRQTAMWGSFQISCLCTWVGKYVNGR